VVDRAIPPRALAGVESWQRSVAWTHNPFATTWRLRAPGGETRYLKVAPLGGAYSLAAERDRTVWAADYLPVARVLDYDQDDAHEWLLTAAVPGATAVDDALRADPARLVPLLAAGLRRVHALPVAACPFDNRPEVAIERARLRVVADLVDPAAVYPYGAYPTAEAALVRLEQLRPRDPELVVCHGDYCLPNVLFDDWRLSGYVDLGRLGVTERWHDLADALWSVTRNLGPGWEEAFLSAYGVARDPAKLEFFGLLGHLLP
jgi:aminoglycoside phosphotransferase